MFFRFILYLLQLSEIKRRERAQKIVFAKLIRDLSSYHSEEMQEEIYAANEAFILIFTSKFIW